VEQKHATAAGRPTREPAFTEIKFVLRWCALVAWLCLGAGCGTPFKYQPGHQATYRPISNNQGVAIFRGEDLREETGKQPKWSRKVAVIVADALADELNHNHVFKRVKVNLGGKPPAKDFSHWIAFKVRKLHFAEHSSTLEKVGKEVLRWRAPGGFWIAPSIPAKFISEVEIEFEVFAAGAAQPVFVRSYAESGSVWANSYQGQTPQIQQTSAALEKVVSRFVADLVRLPLSRQAP
jgi:hypothetical protein